MPVNSPSSTAKLMPFNAENVLAPCLFYENFVIGILSYSPYSYICRDISDTQFAELQKAVQDHGEVSVVAADRFQMLKGTATCGKYMLNQAKDVFLLRIWQERKVTIVFITNNIEEALFLGDRIILLSNKPCKVVEEFVPNLPRPRNNMDPEFLKLRDQITGKVDLAL